MAGKGGGRSGNHRPARPGWCLGCAFSRPAAAHRDVHDGARQQGRRSPPIPPPPPSHPLPPRIPFGSRFTPCVHSASRLHSPSPCLGYIRECIGLIDSFHCAHIDGQHCKYITIRGHTSMLLKVTAGVPCLAFCTNTCRCQWCWSPNLTAAVVSSLPPALPFSILPPFFLSPSAVTPPALATTAPPPPLSFYSVSIARSSSIPLFPPPSSCFLSLPSAPCPPLRWRRPPPSPAQTSCGCTGPFCRRAAALPTTTSGRTRGGGWPRSSG